MISKLDLRQGTILDSKMNTDDREEVIHKQDHQTKPEQPLNDHLIEQTVTTGSPQNQTSPSSQKQETLKISPPIVAIPNSAPETHATTSVQPLLGSTQDKNEATASDNKLTSVTPIPNNNNNQQEQQSQSTSSSQKLVVTKVKLTDELNIFDWFKTTDIINQIAEKAKNSVDSVITTLDPGMREYLYSGGNINIMVISDSNSLVSPIRDSFQSVFGRATVVAARYNPPEAAEDCPIKLANGFDEAIIVAQEKIKRLRLDTSNVPQNQVVVVVQPSIVTVTRSDVASNQATSGLKIDENLLPRWFLTYCMIIEDPVLGVTMNSYSQLIPLDPEVVKIAKQSNSPDGLSDNHLGFSKSIVELMVSRLNLETKNLDHEVQDGEWLRLWSGLNLTKLIFDLSVSLAHSYRRKWNDSISAPCSNL